MIIIIIVTNAGFDTCCGFVSKYWVWDGRPPVGSRRKVVDGREGKEMDIRGELDKRKRGKVERWLSRKMTMFYFYGLG